ncbi:MAG: trans-aconitate 2-methyltransferase [Rhodospirillales bacterium]|nr:trans-aconitate 2-methyltransferase [Rhodospirillales bacterium]
MVEWNPAQYLRFAAERNRPAEDLMDRLALTAQAEGAMLYDLGCGTGPGTRALKARWPKARIVGVDSSPDMLAKAKTEGGDITWVEADLSAWQPDPPADLIFSNAALQWLPEHDRLFPNLIDALKPGGVLAVQMPLNYAAPSHRLMMETADTGPWKQRLAGVSRLSPTLPSEAYYDLLVDRVRHIDLWETTYIHVLEGNNPVVEWVKGTGLRPWIEAAGEHRDAFVATYAERVARAYPKQANGKTLFPFRRLFLVAVK